MTTLRLPPLFASLLVGCAGLAAGCVVDDEPSIDTDGAPETGTPDPSDTNAGDDTGGEPVPDGCGAPTGPGTDVGTALDADVTWTAEGSPYRIAATRT